MFNRFSFALVSRVGVMAAVTVYGSFVETVKAESGGEEAEHGRLLPLIDPEPSPCEFHGVSKEPGRPKKPILTHAGDRDWGDCPPDRYLECQRERSGCPDTIAPWAINSITDKYTAWFVGGSTWKKRFLTRCPPYVECARERKANGDGEFGEGTWGLDYSGCFGHMNVWMGYTPHEEPRGIGVVGGAGYYATDGEPKVVSRAKEFKEKLIHPLKAESH